MLFGHIVCDNLKLIIGNRQLVFGNKQLVFCIRYLHIGSSQPTGKRPYAICKSPWSILTDWSFLKDWSVLTDWRVMGWVGGGGGLCIWIIASALVSF